MGRILGLDVGERRIGVAVSDPMGWTAQGLGVINRGIDEWRAIEDYINKYEVAEVVIGCPYNMDGSIGKKAVEVESFGEKMKKEIKTAIKITYWDERLTTSEAERMLIEADLSRRRRREVIDKIAASIMLQNFLESQVKK